MGDILINARPANKKKLPERVVGDGGNVAVGEEYLLQVWQVERQEDVRPAMEIVILL